MIVAGMVLGLVLVVLRTRRPRRRRAAAALPIPGALVEGLEYQRDPNTGIAERGTF